MDTVGLSQPISIMSKVLKLDIEMEGKPAQENQIFRISNNYLSSVVKYVNLYYVK